MNAESNVIPEGYYDGKLINYGVRLTKGEGKPSVTAIFVVAHAGKNWNIYWQGTFKSKDGGSNEVTLKALLVMGLDDVRKIGDIAKGREGGPLNLGKTYSLKVKVEYDNANDKSFNKVDFINEPGSGGGFKDLVSAVEFAPLVAGLQIDGDFMRLLQEKTGGAKPTITAPSVTDLVPF